jgi:hypothetical protein
MRVRWRESCHPHAVRAAAGPRPGHLPLVVAGLLCATPALAEQLAGDTLDVRHGRSSNEVENI